MGLALCSAGAFERTEVPSTRQGQAFVYYVWQGRGWRGMPSNRARGWWGVGPGGGGGGGKQARPALRGAVRAGGSVDRAHCRRSAREKYFAAGAEWIRPLQYKGPPSCLCAFPPPTPPAPVG